jgi:hypothetical protein
MGGLAAEFSLFFHLHELEKRFLDCEFVGLVHFFLSFVAVQQGILSCSFGGFVSRAATA